MYYSDADNFIIDYTKGIAYYTYDHKYEKYRMICEEISKQIYKEELLTFREKYKDPIKFTEDYLGVKLKWYQKVLLEMAYKKENLLYRIGRSY